MRRVAYLCNMEKRIIDLKDYELSGVRTANPKMYKYMYGETASVLDKKVTKSAKISVSYSWAHFWS